jgi:hypothetical protein
VTACSGFRPRWLGSGQTLQIQRSDTVLGPLNGGSDGEDAGDSVERNFGRCAGAGRLVGQVRLGSYERAMHFRCD